MSPSVTESVIRSNETASVPKVPHSTESHQPYPAPSSSSSNARRGMDQPEHSLQDTKGGPNGYSTPAESSRHRPKVLTSCDGSRSCDDLDPTKPPPQINTVSQDASSHTSKTKVDHVKEAALSTSTYPRAAVPTGPSEPMERSPVATDFQPADDDPIYSIGEVKMYNQKQKAIPKLYEARWQVIRPDIFDRIHKRVTSGRFAMRLNKAKAPPIIELMSAGNTKACSMPAVVVVIPKHIKTMQDFLDTDGTVRSRCKPEDGTTVELLAFACKGSSTLVGIPSGPLRNDIESTSESDSDYVSDNDDSQNSADGSDSSAALPLIPRAREIDAQSVSIVREPSNVNEDVKHGMGIRLIAKDGSGYVRGTCGGILQLVVPNQPPRQVGLIAGHLLDQLGQGSKEEKQNANDSSFSIGDILYPKSSGELPRYDWALFDAAELGFEHDMANHNTTVVQGSELPDVDTVVVIRTSRGEVTGTLSSSASGIMLNPDQGFVHVRTIVLDQDSIVTKGDSGAWVFQEGYAKIYGYLIATNSNGHAYMVLLHEAITEIHNTIGAASVSLAISIHPDSQLRLTTTHEHVAETKTSIPVSGETEPVQSTKRNDFEIREEVASSSKDAQPGLEINQSRLASQSRRAKAYLETGLAQEAIEILKKVMESRQNLLGESHPDFLASQHELAVAYIQTGQAALAIELLTNVVRTEAATLDDFDIGRLTSRHELARAFLADGQVRNAIIALEDVVAVKTKILDKSDPHLLASQIVLAEAYLSANRAYEAISLLDRVVAFATATSIERVEIRARAIQWLDIARRRGHALNHERFAGNYSKPLSIFITPRK